MTAGDAVIYVRISRDSDREGLGVDRQEQACRTLAAREGWRVVDVYVDNDRSAYSGKPRREYLRMRADLAGGLASRVLVWHTDRLHRRNAELESWIGEVAEPFGVTVHSVQAGPIDLATPSGQMVARQLGAVAQYESAIKAQRLRAKMEQKAENGEWLGGPVPFGWRRIGTEKGRGRLEIAPDEAALIASGTRALLDGASARSIVQEWEASGVMARHGEQTNDHWHRRTALGILKRWRNAGVHEHRGEPTPDRPADWPPIPGVSIEDVRAVRELLTERAPGHTFDSNPRHLLSGIARCICGDVMRAASAPKGRTSSHTYRCVRSGSGHVTRGSAPIDELVRAVVVERLRRPDVADLVPTVDDTATDVSELRVTVRRERKRLDELAVMLADGDLDRSSYRTARDRVNERLSEAETTLTAATRRSPLAPVLAATDPGASFLAADLDTQRAVVKELIRVTIGRGEIGRKPFNPDSVVIEWLT